MQLKDIVCWSADVDPPTIRQQLILPGERPIKKVKIDRLFEAEFGLEMIWELQALGYDVFHDAKLIEIPDKVEAIARAYLRRKPWMLNVMAGILSNGDMINDTPKKRDSLIRFADACIEHGTRPCAVTVLTSTEPEIALAQYGRKTIDQVLFYVDFLIKAGFTDVVCSPQEASAIVERFGKGTISINTPAIRMPGSGDDDQARPGTPIYAVEAGSDVLIMGRNLTQGPPEKADQPVDMASNLAWVGGNLAPVLNKSGV